MTRPVSALQFSRGIVQRGVNPLRGGFFQSGGSNTATSHLQKTKPQFYNFGYVYLLIIKQQYQGYFSNESAWRGKSFDFSGLALVYLLGS